MNMYPNWRRGRSAVAATRWLCRTGLICWLLVPLVYSPPALGMFGIGPSLRHSNGDGCSANSVATSQRELQENERGPQSEWIQLFNGTDLTGWTPKIRFHELGENYANTFRVEDGLLKVRYDGYESFDGQFGHLFYKKPFSHYVLRVEYRFVGNQCDGGPGWAFRNSGVMLHGQDPKTMSKDQSFPVSIEMQMLGGNGVDQRTTANLCTPGTNVVMDGKLVTRHCTKSNSQTYHGNQWVTVEIEVRGSKIIRHKIDGKSVLEYAQPQLDPNDATAKPLIEHGNLILESGSLSLQSESHPVDFRKVELKKLD